ncbi:TPA: sigma-70 family RNA polymerase sigma factor [Elizabethkingia anophelis]|nr:sigma-70 family RNA polymerase sigma factor [Elizabethkingia anophelis]
MTSTSAYITHTDDALLSLWKNGDKTAFSFFFERHFHDLVVAAFQRVRDWHLAEELVQDALYSLYKNSSNLSNNPIAYCRNILKKRIIDSCRAKKFSLIPSQDFSEQITDINHNHVEYKQFEQKVHQLIEDLPHQCRKVFLLKREAKLSTQEVSQELGISVKTVENHMTKALSILKEKLEYPVYLGIIIGINSYLL